MQRPSAPLAVDRRRGARASVGPRVDLAGRARLRGERAQRVRVKPAPPSRLSAARPGSQQIQASLLEAAGRSCPGAAARHTDAAPGERNTPSIVLGVRPVEEESQAPAARRALAYGASALVAAALYPLA